MKSHPTPETIRVKDLKKGDKFLLNGVEQKVAEVTEDKIYYSNTNWKKRNYLGRNSEQLVERVK